MKKNDIIIAVATLIYSYLFYDQTPGINIFIFTVVLTFLMALKDANLFSNSLWLIASAGALISGAMTLLHGTWLSVIANIVSLSMAASFSLRRESSLIFALIYAVYSYFFSLIDIFYRFFEKNERKEEQAPKSYSLLFVTVVPVVITLIFFFIYRSANPYFDELVGRINFNFLSWGLAGFTLIGFILLYGYFNQMDILSLVFKDITSPDTLIKDESAFSNPLLSITNENISGIVLFILLNLLLLIVNIVDVYSLSVTTDFPENYHYSQVVHQGINSLILSIVIAIAIILFYFRGSLNFYEGNTAIKSLAILWIFQNALLVVTCAIKNFHYIDEYGLTHKRVGVYIYLIMTIAGLLTTFIKIVSLKSNWFLFRKNAWAGYAVLMLSCLWNWDILIVKYNLSGIAAKTDLLYNSSLSDVVLPDLIAYCKEHPGQMKENRSFLASLDSRKKVFIEEFENRDWQSWNNDDDNVYFKLKALED